MALVTKKFIRQCKHLIPTYVHKYHKNDSTLVSQLNQCLSDHQQKTFGAIKNSPSDVVKNFFTNGAFISVEPVSYNNNSFIGTWSATNYTPNEKIPDQKGTVINDGMNVTYDPKKAAMARKLQVKELEQGDDEINKLNENK